MDPKQLKKVRMQLGITQSALARKAGVSQSLVAKLEAGFVDPSFSTMKGITDALRSYMAAEGKKASQVMSSPVVSVQSRTTLAECVAVMKGKNISQMPVLSAGKSIGSISENQIVKLLSDSPNPGTILNEAVSNVMQAPFPVVNSETPIDALFSLFKYMPAVLVGSGDKLEGIVTKIDLISSETQ